MYGITLRPMINTVLSVNEALGVDRPAAITAAHDRHQMLFAHLGKVGGREDAIPAAVIAALEAGSDDPASDPGVQRAVTAVALGGPLVDDALDKGGLSLLADTMSEYQDELVETWTPAFENAVENMLEAHQTLGSVDLSDTAEIINSGGEAAEAWGRATKAQGTINLVSEGVRNLGMVTRAIDAGLDRKRRTLAIVDLNLDQFDALIEDQCSPWSLICADLDLDLATPLEMRERILTIAATRQKRTEATQQQAQRGSKPFTPESVEFVTKAKAAQDAQRRTASA